MTLPLLQMMGLFMLGWLAASGLSLLSTPVFAEPPATVVPLPQTEPWWFERHETVLRRVRQGGVDLVFIGDSITHGWEDAGRHIWHARYGHRRALNLGFNGDRTEHVLWRLTHGELDGLTPKVAVVMIGTNNSGARSDPPGETAAGIHTIVTTLRARLPETKVLLLGVFPRGAAADDHLHQLNAAINTRLGDEADNQFVFYLDLSSHFLDSDGQVSPNLMPDLLHPNEAGYRRWADGMEDILRTLLGEKDRANFDFGTGSGR